MRTPRQLATEEQLYPAALRILMRRGHSVHEMRKALERRCDDEQLVRRILDRLKEEKLLDDARYSLEFARSHARNRKQGKFRIARELRARGVPDRHVETALEETFAETDEVEILRKRVQRKLKLIRGPLDEKKRASIYRSLMYAGFDSDAVRRELKGAMAAKAEAETEISRTEFDD
jgi:regulatory protein